MVFVWVVLGIAFVLFELHHLAFYALFVAVGCFAAAVAAVIGPEAYIAQAVVASVASVAGIGLVRPTLRAAYERRHPGALVSRGVHGGIIGQEALALDEIGDAHAPGHVRLVGERWLAIAESGPSITAGTTVLVTAVRGTTLVVLPVDALHSPPSALGPSPDPNRS
jgi:membrane protein implicated in regulation of membrane protease activity